MSDVKRYYMNEEGDPLVHAGGRWVTYDEHVAALAVAKAELAEALDVLRTLRDLSADEEQELVDENLALTAYGKRWDAAQTAADAILNRKPTP